MSNLDDLTAALDNHQITDDNGQLIAEETASEDSAPQEQTPAPEDATAEKSADTQETSPEESKASETKESVDSEEPELVETASDETGKRYVPESRFKEVYAKWKAAQREKASPPLPVFQPQTPQQARPIEKTDALEVELLRSTLPQFNPESPEYSREIDELGFSLYEASKDAKGGHTMTRIEAGREALKMAKKLTAKIADVKLEAKAVKAQQSDQGITNRVLNREGQSLDPSKMTLEEKEQWLRENGEWDVRP